MISAFGLACAQAMAADTTQTDIAQSGFSPLYFGVDTETATVPSNPLTAGGPATVSRAYVTRIDLKAPGVSLTTTQQSGPLNTTSETISQFAARTKVRIAINANFFAPCCDAFAEPKTVIGGGATHAWAQIYLPGAGWVPFDPTNGLISDRNLIRVAVTRDPSQAVPLKGSFTGKPGDFLGMEVSVEIRA